MRRHPLLSRYPLATPALVVTGLLGQSCLLLHAPQGACCLLLLAATHGCCLWMPVQHIQAQRGSIMLSGVQLCT